MKRLPVPLIVLLIITYCGNYTQAQSTDVNASKVSFTSLNSSPVNVQDTERDDSTVFTSWDPVLQQSNNPSSCNGSEGSFSFSGLLPNTTYQVTYTDDGVVTGPVTIASNAAGQLTITGLNAGIYSNFIFDFNGSITSVLTGQQLSNPITVPLFSSFASICAGGTPPALPGISNNGIGGTWNQTTVNNQTSGSYIFTPAAGTCGIPVTVNIVVIPKVIATFPFGTSLTICQNGSVPILSNTSTNGITGTWNPAVVDPNNSGTYIFTATSSGCVTGTTFTVTVRPNITPSFTFGASATICEGDGVVTLPNASSNGITGTWSPAIVSNTSSGTYIFTPDAGQCAPPVTYTVTVNPRITPTFTFGSTLTICTGGTVPVLPTTSVNGITGTWTPAVVSNTASGTYTFTSSTPCTPPVTFMVTVNSIIAPVFTFGSSASICDGDPVATLPTTSANGITGTWAPAVVSNTSSGTYTFTPAAGQCATPATYTVTVSPRTIPTFNFGPTLTICSGEAVPVLPATSTNGIAGAWSPAVVSNTTSGTYTFTSPANPCSPSITFVVTVDQKIIPTFTLGASASICAGDPVATLPNTSTNGITGAWNPAVVSNTTSGTYTFTPTAGQCATTTTYSVTVNPIVVPAFTFGTSASVCEGDPVATLPNTSTNGITGAWSPAVVSNTTSGTYTFTPAAGQCATPATYTVTVSPKITPTFNFGPTLTICSGTTLPALPTTSTNGIMGTWAPALNNTATTTYTFTPTAGQCAPTTTLTITVDQKVIPTFTPVAPICTGTTLTALPTTSNNGITGTWAPALNNTATTTYTFTPTAGQCAATTTLIITVNQKVTPTFAAAAPICFGDTLAALPSSSTNVIPVTGIWSPALNNKATTTYTFTPDPGQCAATTTFTWQVTPVPSLISIIRDTAVNDGTVLSPYNFAVDDPAGGIKWNNSNPAIGLAASGTGNIPSFKATNTTDTPFTAIITTIPFISGCAGVSQSYKITVRPLDKDIFVPNIFSPNGDTYNDQLFIYGNYIASVEMQIFNQWGQRLITLTSTHEGWDGKYKGSGQPVGVYVYVLKAVLTNGKKINMKGSVTLIR